MPFNIMAGTPYLYSRICFGNHITIVELCWKCLGDSIALLIPHPFSLLIP